MTKTAARMLRLMDRATELWHIPVIGREKGRLIRRLVERHRPLRAIEIGSFVGYSAILIAGHLPPGGRLTCVEANGYLAQFVVRNVEEAGLGRRVSVVVGDAVRVMPLLRSRSTSPWSTPPRSSTWTTSGKWSPGSAPGPSSWPTTRSSTGARSASTSSTCAGAAGT